MLMKSVGTNIHGPVITLTHSHPQILSALEEAAGVISRGRSRAKSQTAEGSRHRERGGRGDVWTLCVYCPNYL